MSDFGIKTAKQGNEVSKADSNDLIFSSKWRTHKIYKAGTISVTVPANQTTESISSIYHNLKYVPIAEVFVQLDGESFWLLTPDTNGNPDYAWFPMFDWKITSTQISTLVQHQVAVASDKTYIFKYLLFIERLI